jgi:cysteine-rich repeat protein
VQWAQAYQLESAQSDHASVDVREVGGGRSTRLFEFLDPTMQDSVGNPSMEVQESAGWGIRREDISAYAGARVELLFHQRADAALEFSGFAIDDVSVVGCIPACGNGELDDGEECDDENRRDGDCCSAACRFEALGASCADADLCDGAETCNAAGECVAGTPVVCTNGSCEGGRCVTDGMGGAGGESGAPGDSGAGGESTAGQGGSAGSAGTSSAGEGGEGATSGNGGTSAGGSNGGTGVGGEAGTSEGGEAGAGTIGSSKKARSDESSGCGCHVVGRRARGFEALVLGALFLVLARRGRRTPRLFEQTV